MTTPNAMKINEQNYRDCKTYFQGRLMAKGILNQLTARPTNPSDLDDQKAFGILLETTEAGQYQTLPDFIHRFQTLVKRLKRLPEVSATETEFYQVVKLLALMPWDFRHIVDRLSNGSDHDQTVKEHKNRP
ncbi:hypothetical protein DYB28_006671 [Aphanomyces astaci]|uniref:Uncharacterized protein n=1 Tax=Aphanomyces astaci TaxID=112090 RepID=A0A397E3T8_APHAT|nr:hypothetical protein DYB30_009029 [Aphanomyces astaci]RHY73611.1 hypothetical protein DYB34_009615 [Aphanomyces astaci]RHY75147.1 hypothetical protein DYB38_013537 [Aphanomyces astaci]RHZ17981.1 hypothetical protein DYB26_005102 [Aphanomyces astaci]RLO02314.1 hypothetical protein DYB28_006671 [Aphanomyces astaci]